MTTYIQYLRESVAPREHIEQFLDAEVSTWARFDPELGYVLGDSMPKDGIDGSRTISTTDACGARRSVVYADRPCRMNTYGDSFTQCHQVSDHETWQEVLAAHLGEPIRNYGVGGYGVYQAFRRMKRTETSDAGSEYVVLYIWGDDHFRSVVRCRYVPMRRWNEYHRHIGGQVFHGNFWPNIEMDLDNGRFVERENPLATPPALFKMADPDFMVDALVDDLMLQMSLYCAGETDDVDTARLNRLAEAMERARPDPDSAKGFRHEIDELRMAYGLKATCHLIDKAQALVDEHGKKLLVVIFCPGVTRELIETGLRYDQLVVDYLRQQDIRTFDMNRVHLEDYAAFRLSVDEYLGRYLRGHYTPTGNHFFAFAIKNEIVDWLDPSPITYTDQAETDIGFGRGYLPES